MTNLIYISRNFTEFGGFTPTEILDFNQRGIICETDYVRVHDTDAWFSVSEWLAQSGTTVAEPKPAKAKAASRKRTVATRSNSASKAKVLA
ncbi:MAG: hypothetical protein ACOYMN_19985 [Roseimicrobium sp.]